MKNAFLKAAVTAIILVQLPAVLQLISTLIPDLQKKQE